MTGDMNDWNAASLDFVFAKFDNDNVGTIDPVKVGEDLVDRVGARGIE